MEAKFSRLNLYESSGLNRRGGMVACMGALLKDRIATILREQDINKKTLADAADVTKGNVTHWANGTATTMGYAPAIRLHRKYGYSMRWLMRGEGDPQDNTSPDLDPVHEEVLDLWESLVPSQRSEVLQTMRAMHTTNEALKEQMQRAARSVRSASSAKVKS